MQIITALILARILIMFVGQIIGLLLLRRRHPEAPRPFRMWLYPLPALLAMASWLYIFLVQAFEPGGWKYMVYVLLVIVSGVGLFLSGPPATVLAIWRIRPIRVPQPLNLITLPGTR